MKLGVQMLEAESSLNNLMPVNQLEISPGETATVMFQLVNSKSGQRYIPATGATMTARLVSVNDANVVSKIPSQPFSADDRSIWSFSMSATDTSKAAGVNLEVVLTEGVSVKKVWAQSVIVMSPGSPFKA